MRVFRAAGGRVMALGFAPGGRFLVAAHQRHGVFACDMASDAPPDRIAPYQRVRGQDIRFAGDGPTALWLNTGRATGFDFGKRSLVTLGFKKEITLWGFDISSDGTRLVTSSGPYSDSRLTVWRSDPELGWAEVWWKPNGRTWGNASLSAAGDMVAHLSVTPRRPHQYLYSLIVRDAATGEEAGVGRYPYSYISPLAFRPDGGQIVCAHETRILAWGLPGLDPPKVVANDSRLHFTAAAYDPTGRYLFTTSNDATVVVWDTESWERVRRFTWKIGRLRSVAVSGDGAQAAAGSEKGEVVVWDVDE
ncbi:MAG TPA: WD40 repeat domain-containing protein [Gemmataceae bacterium]|nr:WD40 repeat domain-containing protein [Gemmataceae bacterium]